MHELAICTGIVDAARTVLAELPPPPPRVSTVTIRVGQLTSVVPDSLQHHFALLSAGTVLEGARLEIEEIPIRGLCCDCGTRFEIETLCFTCPICGDGGVQLLSGRELSVVSIDTVEGDPPRQSEASDGN